jgi:uncharacterized protein (DUF302 family)
MKAFRNLISLFIAVTASGGLLEPCMAEEIRIDEISHTVVQMRLHEGVTLADAADAMISKAVGLNLKLVGRQPLHQELRERGLKTPHMEVLQFCTPEDARKLVMRDPVYAAYMPCQIALVEDVQGRGWAIMLNLDMLINRRIMPPELMEIAIRINQSMLAVMTAGVTGEF